MKILATDLAGVMIVQSRRFDDERGYFSERFRMTSLTGLGVDLNFVQDNLSKSRKHTLRGLHYQEPKAQGKLISVISGRIFDVAVDIRKGSPNFKKWVAVELTEDNGKMLWVPPGFAHGFLALEDDTRVIYKVTDYWAPDCEHAIRWNDPDLAIDWPVTTPLLNDKDAGAPELANVERLAEYVDGQ